jgi:hypothetical protein
MIVVRPAPHHGRDIHFLYFLLLGASSAAAKLIKEQQQQDGRSIRAHCSLLMDQHVPGGRHEISQTTPRGRRRSGSHQLHKKERAECSQLAASKVGRNPSPRHADQLLHFLLPFVLDFGSHGRHLRLHLQLQFSQPLDSIKYKNVIQKFNSKM